MSDELEEERAARETATTAPDPAAMQTALGATAGTAEARSYLTGQQKLSEKHARLADLQIENLEKLDEYEVSHLRWRRFNDQMRGALQAMFVIALLIVLAGFCGMVWSAATANGLVIEAFSVPPDLAAKGLTGEVVATKMLDSLSEFQAQTVSSRAASSYVNNWGNDIKVQIPDTGVSIGELNRYLRDWLGHETHISGAVYRTPTGIAVTARAGGQASPVNGGSEADLDKLIHQAAEAVYRATQPYRYAVYLDQHGHHAEAAAAYQRLAVTGEPLDRAYAYSAISNDLPIDKAEFVKGHEMAMRALAIEPDLQLARENLVTIEDIQGHDEAKLRELRDAISLQRRRRDPTMDDWYFTTDEVRDEGSLDALLGDFTGATALNGSLDDMPDRGNSVEDARMNKVVLCSLLHDLQCFHNALSALPSLPEGAPVWIQQTGIMQVSEVSFALWQNVIDAEAHMVPALAKIPPIGKVFLERGELPFAAQAHANLGQFALAHKEIDRTPVDCDPCLRIRGTIDALEGNWRGADYWFERAVAHAPSIPLGYSDYGTALLMRGDFEGAIGEFKLANQKGPHFPDPLEMWGEALIRQNRSDLAPAKFSEAAKYAPNWGRLHLKWGEALVWSGKLDEAQKQFDIAATLDLTSTEKSELAHMRASHG
jgi:tetratricopeptide (TPR) repeat protein